MSNLNLRIYAEQFYGLYIPKLNNYLSQSIEKDLFISSFKSGILNYKNISTKSAIQLNPTLVLNSISINSLDIKVPDEKSDLIVDIDELKSNIVFSEISEKNLVEIIINEKKFLKEKFIESIFNKVTNKAKNSFFGGIIFESISNKILSGMVINIKNFELYLKFRNDDFIVNIRNIYFNIRDKIVNARIKELEFFFKIQKNKEQINIFSGNNINISINFEEKEEINHNDEKNKFITKLKIGINNPKIYLNIKTISAILEALNAFKNIKQKKFDLRIKKLIEFHKPKTKDKNYYKLLWLFAIKSLIKLRKFKCFEKSNIFEMPNFTQKILAKKNEDENLILINDINLLKSTKQIIEKKIIDSKDSIANKFFSFFSAKSEEPKSLTDEEKESIDEYFKEENLIKYIKGELFSDEVENKSNNILNKYIKYLDSLDCNADLYCFEMIFGNNLPNKEKNTYLNRIKLDFSLKENNPSFQFNLLGRNLINLDSNNKGTDNIKNSNNENIEEKNIISFSYDKTKKFNILIEKENIEISEDNLFLFICYSKFILHEYIKMNNSFNLFKSSEIKSINIENIFNKIYLSYIPSLMIKTRNENNIYIKISDYSWKDKIISFQVDIKDSMCSIIDGYKFEINLNNGFSFNLGKPLTIEINKELIEQFITNFKNINNEFYIERKQEKKLFNFEFSKYLNNIEILNNNININIKDFNFIINDKNNKSSLSLKDLNFVFENKNLSFTLNQIFTEIDILSLSSIFKEIKGNKSWAINNNTIHYRYILSEIIKSYKIEIKNINTFLYLSHKSSYINPFIKNINVENEPKNIYIIQTNINNILAKYIDINIPNDTIILDTAKIELITRFFSLAKLASKINIDSPFVSLAVLLYNYDDIKKLSKYFLKLKNIYEIKINSLKCEYFKQTKNSDISIYITNFPKLEENKKLDLLNLEQYNLSYDLDSYTDLIIKLNSQKLDGEIAQRDLSYIFFTLYSPNKKPSDEGYYFDRINSLNLYINLNQVRIDFNLRIDYQKPLFDLFFGNFSAELKIFKKNITNLNFSFNDFQLNYYDSNNDNNYLKENKKPLSILYYEIETNKKEKTNIPQIEIKKDIGNKYLINITKINFIFETEIISSLFYYFKDISIFDLISNYNKNTSLEKKDSIENIDIQLIISEIIFLFPRKEKYLNIHFNKIDFNYIKAIKNGIKENQIKLSLNYIESNYLKRIIFFSKKEFLLFVLDIKDNKNISLICNSLLNKIFINLSYLDCVFIYKFLFKLNKLLKIFQKETNKLPKEYLEELETSNNDENIPNNKFMNFTEINSILSEINIEGIDITFLEDDNNYLDLKSSFKYFYPFLNISCNKSYFKFDFNKHKNDINPNINYNAQLDLIINYFNYNYKIWEPLTEDLTLKYEYMNKNETNKLFDNHTLEINKFIVNLSDTFINILLIKIFSYYNKFKTKINENNTDTTVLNEIILKYKISNYTNIDFDIEYKSKNYQLKKSDKIYIDFGIEDEENINNYLNNILVLIPEKSKNKILFFPENICIKKYKIQIEDKERLIFIETNIKEHKHIEIIIYNSIIIKNKTNYSFKINYERSINESNILYLGSNSVISFPENINKDEIINIYLNINEDNNENLVKVKLDEIIPQSELKKMSKDILFKRNNIFFSLVSKIKYENLLFLSIIYKYCIFNCLPCSLFISKNINQLNRSNDNENIEIRKNGLYKIDNASLFTQSHSIFLKIKIQDQYYTSKLSLMRNDSKTKLINFTNSSNDKQVTLQIIIRESYKNKAIIIYSENILYNNSGIGLNIFTQDENNHNYIYDIGNNLYLISSEIKKSNSFVCIKSSKNTFITKYLKYEDIKKMAISGFSLNFEGKKNIYSFDLIIDKIVSNLWCENDENNFFNKINEKNENKTNIYIIIPKYNIINFSGNKNNDQMNLMLKNNQKYFLGIDIKSLEDIKKISNYYMLDNISENSLLTICLKDNIYNIEIKKSRNNRYKNIFIFNNNLKNTQILVENKTNYEIILKQKKFEKLKQKINKFEKQSLKIYEQNNKNFSAEIDNKLYFFNLNETGQKQIKKNLYLIIENDRITTKIIFFAKSITQNILVQKSKSLMNLIQPNYNNIKLNFNKDKYTKINLLVNRINVSIISQNKKERKEIVLLFINNFQCGIKLTSSKSHSKYKIKLNTKIASLEIYNLLTSNNPCLCINTSSPLINLYSELIYDLNKNKITIYELVNEFGDIKLNITPLFLQEIYNFVENIYENTDIYKKNVDNYFLESYKNINLINKQNNYNNNHIPLVIIINKAILSGIKIKFKLKKEGIETLPKLIVDSINYFKCFPFFDIGRETKAILSKIELQGPFKDIKSLLDEIKMNIITQLSTEIVIKVLHPSNNEIKDNMKNMIGFDSSKSNHKINLENSSRIKFKRDFIGKNKFFKKYDKNFSIAEQNIKNIGNFNDKFYIDSFYNFNEEKNVFLFFEDCLIYATENGQNIKNILYSNIKEIKEENCNKKFFIYIKYNTIKKENDIQKISIEFKNGNIAEKIYKLLTSIIK